MKNFQIYLIFLSMLVTGCAVITVGSDFEPGTDFSEYSSFTWDTIDPESTGDPRWDDNPFFDSRVRTAIERELNLRGVSMNNRNPDLVVHYHIYIQQKDRLEVDRYYGEEFGPHAHPLFDTQVEVNISESVEATMMIDISDAVDNRFVWRGWGRFDVTTALDDQKALDERLSKAVQEIIKEFPAG